MTVNELIYMVLDELKLSSDDSIFEPEHVYFLAEKYRAFLLKLRYSDIKKNVPESNYSTICLDLTEDTLNNTSCNGSIYLKSTNSIPFIMNIGNTRVYPIDYYQGEIAYISRDRMRYVGHNKFLKNIIYCSLNPDNHLYFTSNNPQFIYLLKVKITAVFSSLKEVAGLQCPDSKGETICDVFDMLMPIEEALVPPLIELIVKELRGPVYSPQDNDNNAEDDLSKVLIK